MNERLLTRVGGVLDWGRMRRIILGMGMVLSSVVLWAEPAVPGDEGNEPRVVNRVLAVVGGSRVITLWDRVEYRKSKPGLNQAETEDQAAIDELLLDELIDSALFIHEIRHRKGFVMPAGLGDELLADHLRRNTQSRSQLVKNLQRNGETLEQFERELIDDALLRFSLEPVKDSIQVSPVAVSEYYRTNNLEKLDPDLGPFVEIQAFEILASGEGVNDDSMRTMAAGIQSLDEFKKVAQKNVRNDGLKATVYFKNESTFYNNGDVEAAAALLDERAKVGKAIFHKSGKSYHVIFIVARGDKQKPKLSEPRVQDYIKGEIGGHLFSTRLDDKLTRLRQNINVYRPPRK